MINPALQRSDVQDYLKAHTETPIEKFIFKGSPFEDVTVQELAQQLEGRRKMSKKLPLWAENDNVLFPPKINLEQTSSALTAAYKASLMQGNTLIDLTGGFGVDSYYFSKQIKEITHIEMDEGVAAFAKANFKALKALNITTITADSIGYLKGCSETFDVIYIDPSRRSDSKGKVFMLADCLPNVVENAQLLLDKAKDVWIKTAPILDIQAGLQELKHVSEIHIVSVRNEVKELLWRLTKPSTHLEYLFPVDISSISKVNKVVIPTNTVETSSARYGDPEQYLYEPSSALMKSGAFDWISIHYGISKLHKHSHLYTNSEIVDFQGRIFKINEVVKYDKKITKALGLKKANITTRNFPHSVASLRKKNKINEGGTTYLFFTTLLDESKVVLVCEKVNS